LYVLIWELQHFNLHKVKCLPDFFLMFFQRLLKLRVDPVIDIIVR
jgi:hypothetical protein